MAIISICVFSSVFCTKLGLAIRSRRSLGLKQFGAMQIIFIMGCQTLTIPGKFPTACRLFAASY
jgi:pheromone alpha factor receptor